MLADDAELFPDFCTNELWAKLTEKNKWAVKVALNLLHETSKGEASDFNIYISQLPKDFDLLSNWTDDELKMLQYPAVTRAAEACSARKTTTRTPSSENTPRAPWTRSPRNA